MPTNSSRGLRAIAYAALATLGCGDDALAGRGDAGARDDAGVATPDSGPPPAAAVPRFEPHACQMPVPDGLTARDYRCGTFVVAADRDAPEKATLAIEVAVLAATAPDPEPDPVVFLGGGPGAASLDGYLQTHSARILSPIRQRRDIVFFDQRGSGRSRPAIACPELRQAALASVQRDDSPQQEAEVTVQAFAECHARLAVEDFDLSLYHSAATAQDVAELTQALGYDAYNLYGISYGGRIAQVVLRDRPERVRSAILDASVLPEADAAGATAANLDDALQNFFADCLADGSCEAGLESQLYQAYAQLSESPFIAEVKGNPDVSQLVWNGHRALTVVQGLLTPERSGLLATTIGQFARGEYGLLNAAANALIPDPVRATPGYFAAVMCAEELPFEDAQTVARAQAMAPPELVEATAGRSGDYLLALCERFVVPPRPAIENEPVASDVPALILHGSYDAAVHPSAAEAAHANLTHSQRFVFPRFGHGVLRSLAGDAEQPSCAQRMVAEFLDDPDATVDGSCADAAAGR